MRSRMTVVRLSARTVARRRLGYDSEGRPTMRDRDDLPLSDLTADDLPPPGDGFAWRASRAGLTLVCRALEPCAAHLFTTREWRLGTAAADDRDGGWQQVAEAMDVDATHLSPPHQGHGGTVGGRGGGGDVGRGAGPPGAEGLGSRG